MSVVRFKPSFVAAPLGPPITQPTDSSVRRIRMRSESLSVVGAGEAIGAGEEVVVLKLDSTGKGLGSTPSLERITARSIKFCNSRMLPGAARMLRKTGR